MIAMRMLAGLPLFQALGWSLLYFIWQGSLVAILLLLARSMLRECGADVRYGLACVAMLLMLMLPLPTAWFIGTSSQAFQVQATAVGPRTRLGPALETAARQQTSGPLSASPPLQERLHQRIDPLLPWLVALWLAGVLLLSFRFWAGWLYAQRLTKRDTHPLAGTWQDSLLRLRRRLRVTRPVVL